MTIGNFGDGLAILRDYCEDGDIPLAAEHDEFFVAPSRPVSETDAERLDALGWTYVEEHAAWRAFV